MNEKEPELRALIDEMRHDAEIEAWIEPAEALEHYASRLESCLK